MYLMMQFCSFSPGGRLKGGSFKQKKNSSSSSPAAWKSLFSGAASRGEKRRTGDTTTAANNKKKISNPEINLLAVNQVLRYWLKLSSLVVKYLCSRMSSLNYLNSFRKGIYFLNFPDKRAFQFLPNLTSLMIFPPALNKVSLESCPLILLPELMNLFAFSEPSAEKRC